MSQVNSTFCKFASLSIKTRSIPLDNPSPARSASGCVSLFLRGRRLITRHVPLSLQVKP